MITEEILIRKLYYGMTGSQAAFMVARTLSLYLNMQKRASCNKHVNTLYASLRAIKRRHSLSR